MANHIGASAHTAIHTTATALTHAGGGLRGARRLRSIANRLLFFESLRLRTPRERAGATTPRPLLTATIDDVRPRSRRERYYKPARSGGRIQRTPGSARAARRVSRTPLRIGHTPPRRLEGWHSASGAPWPSAGREFCRWRRKRRRSRGRALCSGPAFVRPLLRYRRRRRMRRTAHNRSRPRYTPPGLMRPPRPGWGWSGPSVGYASRNPPSFTYSKRL